MKVTAISLQGTMIRYAGCLLIPNREYGWLIKVKEKTNNLFLVRISIAFLRMSSTGYGWGAGQEESM